MIDDATTNRTTQNPELHNRTGTITILKQNPLCSKEKLNEPQPPLFSFTLKL